MSNVYHKVEYKKLKINSSDKEELVSLIKVSPQMMAEGDFSGIILKQDGSGYILDSDGEPLKKNNLELKDFIEKYCSLSQKNLKNQLKNRKIEMAREEGKFSEKVTAGIERIENWAAENGFERGDLGIKDVLKNVGNKMSEQSPVLESRSEKIDNVVAEVKSEEPTKKRNRKNRNGLR